MTIDVIGTAPQQSAGPAGGLPGRDTAGGPAGVADAFASLVAQLSGSDPSQPAAPSAPQTFGTDPPIADAAAGVLPANPGRRSAGRKSGAGTTGGDAAESTQAVADQPADPTAAVVVAPWVWTLPEIREQVLAAPALSAKSELAAPNDPSGASAAGDGQHPASIQVTSAAANAGTDAAANIPNLPLAPVDTVGPVAGQSGNPTGMTIPAVVLKPLAGAPAVPAADKAAAGPPPAAPAPATAAAEAYRQASQLRTPDGAARSRDLPAANNAASGSTASGTTTSGQVAPVASRESGSAFVQPSTGTNESSDRKSDHAFAGQGGQDREPLPVSASIDAAVSGIAHNEQSNAATSGQIAATVVATSPGATTAAAASVQSTVAPPIAIPDDAGLSRQIVQAVRLQWHDGVGDARLTLKPDYLGEVTISLRVEQGAVTAHLNADTSAVRAWMSANEPLLRQGLAEQGLTLDRLIVSDESAERRTDDEGRRAPLPQQDEDKPRPRPQRDTSTFEIIV